MIIEVPFFFFIVFVVLIPRTSYFFVETESRGYFGLK